MKTLWRENQILLFVLGTIFLAIFLKFWEPGIGISSATYGAFAAHILRDGGWFHFSLGPGLFDPFVDHPYLGIWLDALVFKIFGVSAQTVRLVGSVAGLAVFFSLFTVVRARFGELAAFLSCVALLLCNVFMNYINSGWLDMPMIGFTWVGFCAVDLGIRKRLPLWTAIGGALLGCAVITKGAAAIGVIPVLIWAFVLSRKKPALWLTGLFGFLLPIAAFTLAHYQAEGFFFWKHYFLRQAAINGGGETRNLFWYPEMMLKFAHLVFLLAILAFVRKWQPIYALVLGEIFLHCACYAFSTRHYGQYVIPVLPWLALPAGVYVASLRPNVPVRLLARGLFCFALFAFVILDLVPVRVHSGNENPFRPFQTALAGMKDNGHVYFLGKFADQASWEDVGSYIAWYWRRSPLLKEDPKEILTELQTKDPQALGLVSSDDFPMLAANLMPAFPDIKRCLWNDKWVLLSNQSVCPESLQSARPAEPRRQVFSP